MIYARTDNCQQNQRLHSHNFRTKTFFSNFDLRFVMGAFRTISDSFGRAGKISSKNFKQFRTCEKKIRSNFFRTFEIVRNALRMNVGSKFAKKVFVRKLCDATSEQNAVHSFQIILLPFHLFRLCLHRMSLSCLSVFVQ